MGKDNKEVKFALFCGELEFCKRPQKYLISGDDVLSKQLIKLSYSKIC